MCLMVGRSRSAGAKHPYAVQRSYQEDEGETDIQEQNIQRYVGYDERGGLKRKRTGSRCD